MLANKSSCEMFILSDSGVNKYVLHNSNVNHYDNQYKLEQYIQY